MFMKRGLKTESSPLSADQRGASGPPDPIGTESTRGLDDKQPDKLPSTASIDRVIRWCAGVFASSIVILGAIAWYAIKNNRVADYLNVAGVVYLGVSLAFLGIITAAFLQGHLGSSREVEAPKLELFELEKKR